jgi:hypothetical protein
MTKQIQFVSTMAGATGAPIQLSTCMGGWSPLDLEINNIVKALALVQFRGTVTFTVSTSTGDPYYTSIVSFTNDIPNGLWNTTNHHPQ